MKFAIESKLVQDSMWFSLSVKGTQFSWNIELLLRTGCNKFPSLADSEFSGRLLRHLREEILNELALFSMLNYMKNIIRKKIL